MIMEYDETFTSTEFIKSSFKDKTKTVRAWLKEKYPDTKFSVRMDRNSHFITIKWTGEPDRHLLWMVMPQVIELGNYFCNYIDFEWEES